MYQSNMPFLESELDYRRDRLRTGTPRKHRHPRTPWRRGGSPAGTPDAGTAR